MTLGEYIKIKDSTLIDIINYAKAKGLELQNDESYILSECELKIIDPILSYSLKYKTKGKEPSITQKLSNTPTNMDELQEEDRPEEIKPEQTDTFESDASDVFRYGIPKDQKLNVVGKVDLSMINQGNRRHINRTTPSLSISETESMEAGVKAKRSNRHLGIVKFYDSFKGFGFIITNKYISQTSTCEIESIYVNESNIKGSSGLRDNQWVSFEKKKGKRGVYADNVEIVTFDEEDLLLSLKYTDVRACIKGNDRKGDHYDINVFCKIASSFIHKEGEERLFNIISNHFLKIANTEKRNKAIHLFLSDVEIRNFLLNITIQELDDLSKDILSTALYLEVSENAENINWPLIDKWHTRLPFSSAFYDVLLMSCLNKDSFLNIVALNDDLLQDLLARTENLNLDSESLKSIYLKYPTKLHLFISGKIDNPLGNGLLYLVDNEQVHTIDLNTFQSIVNDDELVKPFLSKYYSVDRSIDSISNSLDIDARKRVIAFIDPNLVPHFPPQMRYEYYILNNDFSAAGELAVDYVAGANVLHNPLSFLFENSSENNDDAIGQFTNYIQSFTAEQINKLTDEIPLSDLDIKFVEAVLNKYEYPVWGNREGLPVEYYIQSYIHSRGDSSYISGISDNEISQWIDRSQQKECGPFLSLVLNGDYEKNIIDRIDISLIAKCIKGLYEESAQLETINKLPSHVAKDVILGYFKDTRIYSHFMHDKWEELKLQVSHLTFDLESDGDNISEFAFRYEENTRSYSSGRQIGSLIRRINDASIIVGHNIKEWDLPILTKHGLNFSGFIWDTLEIELLLNPCRYAYSLKTTHIAKDDVELTDNLFWNQLLRLSFNQSLCKELKSELPEEINEYLRKLQDPFFAEAFKVDAKDGYQFFQELVPLNKSVISKLRDLDVASEKEDILVIAPRDIWPRIAQYISLKFPAETSKKYYIIDVSGLAGKNMLLRKYLYRFCEEAKTPLFINLPQYLRYGKDNRSLFISNDIIDNITRPSDGRIDCIDFESFDSIKSLKSQYSKIITIGGELHDRIHKVQIGDSYDSIGPNMILSKLFLSMAACNYALVPTSDYNHFGIKKDELTASIWAERDTFGKITIFKNFKFKIAKESFLSHFNATNEHIEWKLENQDNKCKNPTIITIKNDKDSVRLSDSTTLRSHYWAYQFGIIKRICTQLPIIYVVNNSQEVEALSNFARALGYYVPSAGTGFRKLEHIESHANSLVVISKNQFVHGIGEYRTNQPYCYIWDSMDIDRLRLMWDVLPFEDDELDNINNEVDNKIGRTTPRKCIVAAWPIIRHYYSLIKANSRDSQMLIIDTHFDDNPDIVDICNCEQLQVNSPANSEEFAKLKAISETYFKDSEFTMPELDTDTAMEAIRNSFIPDYIWHDYQKEILPVVLRRENDLLISLPTGGGKSIIFQGPAIYRAASSHRLSIVISPLRALMQEQVEELTLKGFGSAVDYISGDRTYTEVQEIYRRIRGGEIALLYITPERFRVKGFVNALQQRLEHDKGLEYVVFDEAHCISQWGQEFRPDYRNAILECSKLKERFDIKLCLLSATVTAQIEDDIRTFLPDIRRMGQAAEDYNPIRQHIGITFKLTDHEDERRIDEICSYIIENQIDFAKSRMIIFCRTQRQCEEVCTSLTQRFQNIDSPILNEISGHIGFFHAGMDSDQRNETYKLFKGGNNNVNTELFILCATKAFGMGMDIPNIHYILHFGPPSVMEDYLQEVGRAGRNAKMYNDVFADGGKIPAHCLVSIEDFRKLKELLIRSLMSWSDLDMARQKIIEYVQRFKSIDEASNTRTVVPFNIWTKDESPERFNDTTASRIAFHWLEHLNLINLGYLDQACLDITLLKAWSPIGISAGNSFKEEIGKALKDYCSEFGTPSLIPIKEMRDRTGHSWPKIVDVLLQAQKNSIITINDSIRAIIKPRRFSETDYMVTHNKNVFALHLVMDGIKSILSKVGVGKSRVFENDEIRRIVRQLTNEVQFDTITENGIEYMPWRDQPDSPSPRMDVKRAETFKKDFIQRTGPKIFWLLNYIPGVSSVEKHSDEGDVFYIITLRNKLCQEYVDDWENDLFNILKYIKDKDSAFSWAEMIFNLQMFSPGHKGFNYLDNSLSLLKAIQYIDYTPLVKAGIEVQASKQALMPIDDGTEKTSRLYDKRQEFEQEEKLKKIRLSSMDIFSKISPDKQSEFIRRYFQGRNYDEFLGLVGDYCPNEYGDILTELSEEALAKEESKLQGNESQLAIYNSPISQNINVLAGPGSGKTHVLTLRCAKLVYREHVDPSHILVLAYNRAVVVELKNRLNRLFRSLGLSRMAHQMHVYTFHALAKVVMGHKLDNEPTEQWEILLCDYIKKNRSVFKAKFPEVDHVLIDEFQDITTPRLETISKIHEYYPDARFFTIGDINQSIYGFDRVNGFIGTPKQYAERLAPQPYYTRLREMLCPVEKGMFTNYRSYQEILDKAAEFVPDGCELPKSATSLMKHAPSSPCVSETSNKSWYSQIKDIANFALAENNTEDLNRKINNIAIFFRTNNEVYRGFSRLKELDIDSKIRIRIQGTSSCELWRQREVYHVVSYFSNNPDTKVVLKNNETKSMIKNWIEQIIQTATNWDSYYLDITYTLCLHYLETIRTDERTHTYGELADFIKDIAGRDDGGQVFKIYDEYQCERIFKEKSLTIVLTTMHKVKGLEFDIVVITPSFANLPLRPHRTYAQNQPLMEDDLADLEEERRLRFVAYTRAKKKLYIFNNAREQALANMHIYLPPEVLKTKLGIVEKEPGLDKYNLGFHSGSEYNFRNHKFLLQLRTNSPIIVKRTLHKKKKNDAQETWHSYDIIEPNSNTTIGQLSQNSTIKQQMEKEGINTLENLFVSEISAWEYKDTIKFMAKHGFIYKWITKAIEQGYVYIVQIAGFGIKKD